MPSGTKHQLAARSDEAVRVGIQWSRESEQAFFMQNVKDSPHFECNVLDVLDAHRRIRISIVENGQDSLKEIEQPGFFDTDSLDVQYEKLGSPKQQNNVSLSFFQLPHSCFSVSNQR